MPFLLPYQVGAPNFSSFGLMKLILTQVATVVAYWALPVTWSTNLIYYVISITVTSMSTKFQLICSNRTHYDPRCCFCGASNTSSNLVHKLNILFHFYCPIKYVYQISAHLVQKNSFWPKLPLFWHIEHFQYLCPQT
jgi:hypothetical protein